MPGFASGARFGVARFVAPHGENGGGESRRAMERVRPLIAPRSVLLFP